LSLAFLEKKNADQFLLQGPKMLIEILKEIKIPT